MFHIDGILKRPVFRGLSSESSHVSSVLSKLRTLFPIAASSYAYLHGSQVHWTQGVLSLGRTVGSIHR